MPIRHIEFAEYAVLFGKQIRRLDCETQYAVLIRRFDTSYPTGGYGVSGDQSEQLIQRALLRNFWTSLKLPRVLPFEEGKLSVKYLGVPLVSSRLRIRDCNELVDRVQLRIQDWKNKSLLIAGRLQLIQSLMRQFLWSNGSSGKSKSKVAWEVVCLPKNEGGLGIRRLECFNSALMTSHVWKLLTLKESLWVKWIHEYKLKGRNFWYIPLVWRNHHGIPKKFTVSQVWMDIRYRDSKVSWYNMVWFPYCIPRHAFNLWLIVRKKLTTQDLIPVWDRLGSLVWLKLFAGLDSSNPNIYDIIQSILPIAKRRTMKSVVAKIVVAATAYFIWQERN
ncbi:reverse transcriptase domain, reverse transcriptase zinc-binding domain protein [Tanacetum coccineum]